MIFTFSKENKLQSMYLWKGYWLPHC